MCDSNDTKCFVFYGFLARDCQQRIGLLPAPLQFRAVRRTRIFTGCTPHKHPACKRSKRFAFALHSWFHWRINRQINIALSNFSRLLLFLWLLGGIQRYNKEQAFPVFFRLKLCIKVLNGTKTEPVPHAGLLQRDNAQLINLHWIYRTDHTSPQ